MISEYIVTEAEIVKCDRPLPVEHVLKQKGMRFGEDMIPLGVVTKTSRPETHDLVFTQELPNEH